MAKNMNVFTKIISLFLLLILTTAVAEAKPKNVALFTNGIYVNVTPITGEAVREQATLVAKAHVVSTFTSISDVGFIAALVGQDALVIPELSMGDLSAGLTPAAMNVIKTFINSGGVMVVHGESVGGRGSLLLNTIFGWGTSPSAPGLTLDAAAAVGTPFNGASPALPVLPITTGILNALLPVGAKTIYTDGTNSSVVLIPYGFGHVVYLGWNWFNAAPTGTADGGWKTLLDASVNVVSTAPKGTPPPSPIGGAVGGGCSINPSSMFDPTILTMLILSFGYLIRKRRHSN